ncbi:hypothetical protein RHDC4_00490 [Rhodocyclaceae bacterium]|nr:hypothetical protein RHDC4_00490 [Rhodocyclaceae bacterium]
MASIEGLLSIEVFAAKDTVGVDPDMFMAVSCKCGLREAEALRIDGNSLVALQHKSIMPIDFPPLSTEVRAKLLAWAQTGKPLPVAEFMARGVYDAYFVDLVVAS